MVGRLTACDGPPIAVTEHLLLTPTEHLPLAPPPLLRRRALRVEAPPAVSVTRGGGPGILVMRRRTLCIERCRRCASPEGESTLVRRRRGALVTRFEHCRRYALKASRSGDVMRRGASVYRSHRTCHQRGRASC